MARASGANELPHQVDLCVSLRVEIGGASEGGLAAGGLPSGVPPAVSRRAGGYGAGTKSSTMSTQPGFSSTRSSTHW